MKGFEGLRLDSLEKMKNYLTKFREELADPLKFREIYLYAFHFSKAEPEQKCIEMEMAVGMLKLLAVEKFYHAKNFCSFLEAVCSFFFFFIEELLLNLVFLCSKHL